ncbi:MAG: hypothetical protein ACYC7D_07315 [Nitrososphaerales archaeon]
MSFVIPVEQGRFREVYASALSFAFEALGRQISKVVIDYISRKFRTSAFDTSGQPRFLCEALEKSLGYGAILIETRIVNSIYSQLSIPLQSEPEIRMGHPEDFEKYIFAAKEKIS